MVRLLAALPIFFLACGSGGPQEGSKSCTFESALKGRLPCQLANASTASGRTVLNVLSTDVPSPILAVRFDFPAVPAPGDFVGDTNGTGCSITLDDLQSQSVWYASTLPTERNGKCALTLGHVRLLNDGVGTNYDLHGTFTATLAPSSNSTRNVELSGGF